MGLEMLGGILLKLELTFSKGCFSSLCRFSKAWEEGAMAETEDDEAIGRPSAWALLSQVERIRESMRTRAASAIEYAFIVKLSLCWLQKWLSLPSE